MSVNIVSTSGGRTSMYLSIKMREQDPNSISIFMDTGAEHEETYRFLKECNDFYNLEIICIKAVIPIELGQGVRHEVVDIQDLKHDNGVMADYMRKNGTPVSVGATCSERMKTLAFRSWVKSNFSKDEEITAWLGMRIDEPARLSPKEGIRYLAEISDFDKSDIIEWWSNQEINLKIPEHLGNCVFCVKKSAKKIALAARHEPEKAKKWQALIDSDIPRAMPNRADPKEIMYRDYKSFFQIVSEYEDVPTQDLERLIGLYRDDESDACSSSCNGDFSMSFRRSEYQADMFKEVSILVEDAA